MTTIRPPKRQIVQDPVEVFCRVRPKPILEKVSCVSLLSTTELSVVSPDSLKSRKTMNCKFNHIFTEQSAQKEIFDYIAMPLLKSFVQGENGLLLTYGVTGSGKTYTMCGEPNNPGIIPRCIHVLFNTIGCCQTPKFLLKSDKFNGFEQQELADVIKDQKKDAKMRRNMPKKNFNYSSVSVNDGTQLDVINKKLCYTIFINYIEIYNNNTYDLLDENAGLKSLQAKILREDSNKNIYVNGVVEIEVKTAEEAFELYCIGSKRRRMGQTSLNTESSRSHSIFTIRLAISNNSSVKENGPLIVSQLSLVDLAGSERCNRSNTVGARLKEAGSINNSLMALKTCLEILRENNKTENVRLVPYRESRLTLLFKNYFDGEGKIRMIICVNPSVKDFEETVHVMKFSEISQDVLVLRPNNKITGPENEKSKIIPSTEVVQHFVAQSLPSVRLLNPESEEIKSLILYLNRRRQIFTNIKMIRNTCDQFRLRLVDLEAEKNSYERQCKYLLPAEHEKVRDLKHQLINMGHQYDQMKENYHKHQEIIQELKRTIQEKDFKLKQNVIERTYNTKRKINQVTEKMTHELDVKLRRQRDFLNAQIKEKSDQLEFVKDILVNNETINSPPIETFYVSLRDTPARLRRSRSTGDS